MRPPTGHLPSQRQGVEGSSGNWQTSARGLDPARRASAGRLGSVTEHLTGPSSLPTEALLRPRLMLGSTASQSQADKVRATQTLQAKPPPGQAGQAQMGRGRQPGSAPLLAPSPRTLRVAIRVHTSDTNQASRVPGQWREHKTRTPDILELRLRQRTRHREAGGGGAGPQGPGRRRDLTLKEGSVQRTGQQSISTGTDRKANSRRAQSQERDGAAGRLAVRGQQEEKAPPTYRNPPTPI